MPKPLSVKLEGRHGLKEHRVRIQGYVPLCKGSWKASQNKGDLENGFSGVF